MLEYTVVDTNVELLTANDFHLYSIIFILRVSDLQSLKVKLKISYTKKIQRD